MTTPPEPSAIATPRSTWRRLIARPGGLLGMLVLAVVTAVCLVTLPYTLAPVPEAGLSALGSAQPSIPRYDAQNRDALRLPPSWAVRTEEQRQGYLAAGHAAALRAAADRQGVAYDKFTGEEAKVSDAAAGAAAPSYMLGTDGLGRSMLIRCLLGGAISLTIGLAAAGLSMLLGTAYGAVAGMAGGRTDAAMMRIVDVLYGLPYVLLVVLLAVAVDGVIDRWQTAEARAVANQSAAYVEQQVSLLDTAGAPNTQAELARLRREAREKFGTGEVSTARRQTINLVTMLAAIGGVSWLTMARVIRGQVLSLKAQPFMEAARAVGVPLHRQFRRHLLPNLAGPIIVYATLTVPQAILQESFLSFLGIGIKPPLPSWGNLAADGLAELNPVKSDWWLLVFPCILLAVTLLALNFVGEALREVLDPKRSGGRA